MDSKNCIIEKYYYSLKQLFLLKYIFKHFNIYKMYFWNGKAELL